MKIKLLLTLSVLLIANFATAEYVVLKYSGKPLYSTATGKTWTKIAKGDQIEINGQVRLNPSEYLLIKSEFGLLEFNIKGTYKLNEYEGKLKKLDELALNFEKQALDSIVSNTPKKNKLYQKSLLDAKTDQDLFSVFPSPTITYDNEIELKWRPMDNNTYIVTLAYNEESIYYYREVNGDKLNIDLFELQLPTDRCLYWSVQVKGSQYKSKPKCIYILNIGETSNIELPRYQLENQLNLERSAVHNLMMALFYEKNKIMHRAEKHYRLAWDLAQHDKRYKQIYYNFLNRRNSISIE
ncbi:MAG: hypothetical protein ACPGLV_13420 [Bacteroidia bacterium]